MRGRELRIISGTRNETLAAAIVQELEMELTPTTVSHFSDGETHVKIEESVRNDDVFIIQSTCGDVNGALMELLLTIDAARRASAGRITAVIPYFGYSRQDRKAESREPISAKLVANLLQTAGAHRVVLVDPHTLQLQGFFDIPVDTLTALPLIAREILKKNISECVVVSPDVGSVKRARKFAELIKAPLAIIDKRRVAHNEAEVMHLVGDVAGKQCILIDDMIDTAGTIVNAAEVLRSAGGTQIYCCAVHPVLSGPAVERLSRAQFKEVLFSDTIFLQQHKCFDGVVIVSVAALLAQAIYRIHTHASLSTLFTEHCTNSL